MKRTHFLIAVVVGFTTVGVLPAGTASALPPLPASAGEITPDVNWSQFLTPLMNSSAIVCTVTSAVNTSEVVTGATLAPMTNLMVDGLKLRNIITDSDANVGATCTSEVTIPATPITVTGTLSAPSMPADVGTSGSMTLACTATSNTPTIVVSVTANFGGAVPGKARITGQGSTGAINISCNMGLIFNPGTGIAGTVTGTLNIGSPTVNPSCSGQSTATCIPVSLSGAEVTVDSGSGALAEAQGSGIYSFNDSFKLSAIDSALATVGASSLRAMSQRPAVGANSDELKITLTAGRHRVKAISSTGGAILVKSGTKVLLTSSPTASCKVTATFKKTTVTLASTVISATGSATYSMSSSAVKKLKAAGAKKNTKLSMTTTCKLGTKTATSKSSPKFSG